MFSVCVKLSVEARLEITKRAQKALKGISEKSKKKGNDDRSENSASSCDSALTHIQQSLAHLETLSHSFPLSLKTSQEVISQHTYTKCTKFDYALVIWSSKTNANYKQLLKYYVSGHVACPVFLIFSLSCSFPSPSQFLTFLTCVTVAVIDWQVCSWCPVSRIVAGSPCQPVVS